LTKAGAGSGVADKVCLGTSGSVTRVNDSTQIE